MHGLDDLAEGFLGHWVQISRMIIQRGRPKREGSGSRASLKVDDLISCGDGIAVVIRGNNFGLMGCGPDGLLGRARRRAFPKMLPRLPPPASAAESARTSLSSTTFGLACMITAQGLNFPHGDV